MNTTGGTQAPAPPEILADRYRVGEVLGQGGMGEVRAGHDERLNRDVAIKILRPELAFQPSIRQRFEDEAKAAARLVHPHVVAVFDSGEDAGVPFLVMERLSGLTLADEIASAPLAWEAVQALGEQVLKAVAAAHAAGFIHRDIKPGNILVAAPGNWKIGDFGIAKSLETVDPSMTSTGLIVGTPAYLPPERLLGGPATASSDIYAAGVVLYEALAGQRPFDAAGPAANALSSTPTPLSDLRGDVPPGFANLVLRAMARDPSDRFASAEEMAAALAVWGPVREAGPQFDATPAPALTSGPVAADEAAASRTIVLPEAGAQHTTVMPQLSAPHTVVLPPDAAIPAAGPAAGPAAMPYPLTPTPPTGTVPAGQRRRRRRIAVGLAVAVVAVVLILSLTTGRHPATPSPAVAATPAATASLPAPLASALDDLQHQVQP